MPLIIFTAKSIATKRNAGLFAAACLGILTLNNTAYGNPTGDAQARNRAEASRTMPQRHARPAPDNNRLRSTPAVAVKRPMFGWPKLVTEARKYVGTNPTARKKLWCATFMNMVLARTGYAGTGSDAARSFASYGKRVNDPQVGAIAVLTRGKNNGHVGIVTGIDANGNPIIISGNHGKRVGEATYSRNRVIAYVMPAERSGVTQLASAGPSLPQRMSDADQDGGISSPIAELLAAINAERSNEQRPQPLAREPMRQTERATAQRPQERAQDRIQERAQERIQERVTARQVERPVAVPYRVAPQTADIELPRPRVEAMMRVSAVVPGTPLPRERAALPAMPMPRSRPQ
jgi:uncharacterized protein (TIGR02594 family)